MIISSSDIADLVKIACSLYICSPLGTYAQAEALSPVLHVLRAGTTLSKYTREQWSTETAGNLAENL